MEIRSRLKQREMVVEWMERCHLKQRISQVLRASLRSSCSITSRDATDDVLEPVLVPRRYDQGNNEQHAFQRLHHWLPPLPIQHRRLSAHRREMTTGDHCQPTVVTRKPKKKSMRKDRRVSNGGGRTFPPGSPVSPSYYSFAQMREELEREGRRIAEKKKRVMEENRVIKKKKLLSNSYGFTSPSSEGSDNDDVEVLFGSDETETLLSSRSFSSDSSEVYYSSSCRCSRRKKKKKTPQRQRQRQRKKPREVDGEQRRHCNTSGNGFRPFVSISSSSSIYFFGTEKTHEGMAAEVMEEEEEEMETGFAVEKHSSDPREDFRSSMLEMIMEKQVFGARDLESLLLRYLSLNSPNNHPIILEVFSEIRETLFCH